MTQYRLERTQTVTAPLETVTAFFESPKNLGEITPPFLNFSMKGSDVEMREGVLIDYTIRLHGIPMSWRTCIDRYNPGSEFVDRQVRGPYKFWHHLHTFRAVDGGTELSDIVTYELPFGILGRLAHFLFVKRQLTTIFAYRAQVVAKRFGSP